MLWTGSAGATFRLDCLAGLNCVRCRPKCSTLSAPSVSPSISFGICQRSHALEMRARSRPELFSELGSRIVLASPPVIAIPILDAAAAMSSYIYLLCLRRGVVAAICISGRRRLSSWNVPAHSATDGIILSLGAGAPSYGGAASDDTLENRPAICQRMLPCRWMHPAAGRDMAAAGHGNRHRNDGRLVDCACCRGRACGSPCGPAKLTQSADDIGPARSWPRKCSRCCGSNSSWWPNPASSACFSVIFPSRAQQLILDICHLVTFQRRASSARI